MPWQADLFDSPESERIDGESYRKLPSGRRTAGGSRVITPEAAAKVLDASDDYRVLRRLRPREIVVPRPPPELGERLTVVIDTESTGLDHRQHEIIELGMLAFVHDDQGTVLDVTGEFSA